MQCHCPPPPPYSSRAKRMRNVSIQRYAARHSVGANAAQLSIGDESLARQGKERGCCEWEYELREQFIFILHFIFLLQSDQTSSRPTIALQWRCHWWKQNFRSSHVLSWSLDRITYWHSSCAKMVRINGRKDSIAVKYAMVLTIRRLGIINSSNFCMRWTFAGPAQQWFLLTDLY